MRLPYFVIFQILSLVMSLVYFRHIRKFGMQLMVPLLVLICGIEITATNMNPNIHVYNLYPLISPVFYFLLYLNIIRMQPKLRAIYIFVSIVSLIFFIFDYFFIKPGQFNYYSMIVSMVEYFILSCIVLYQLVTDDTKQAGLTNEPYFWFAAGTIVFSVVSVVVIGLYPYILRNQLQIFGKNAYRIIMPMVNVFMYSCFAYAFYLCKKYDSKSYKARMVPSKEMTY